MKKKADVKESNLLKQRDIRTINRKLLKEQYDSMFTLSATDEKGIKARLLDEGAVLYSDGEIWFYIAKGTLEKYLEALPEDYVGTINLGHMDFGSFPFLLGTWTKDDLSLVDIGEGRKGLDVTLRLDPKSIFVKELKRMPYDIGLSAEFSVDIDWDATHDMGVEVVDGVFIKDFALVGECGNVNSSDLSLKGETKVKDVTKNLEVTEEVTEEVPAEEAELAVTEEITEEPTETTEEAENEAEEAEEEIVEEAEGEEEAESEEDDDDEGTSLDEVLAAVKNLQAQVEDLTNKNEALKKKNKKLQSKLDKQHEKEKTFSEHFKDISVSLGLTEEVEKPVEPKHEYINDGIGEL